MNGRETAFALSFGEPAHDPPSTHPFKISEARLESRWLE